MVVDTSVLIAFLNAEPEAARLEQVLVSAPRRFISAATLVEAGIVASVRTRNPEPRISICCWSGWRSMSSLSHASTRSARTAYRQFGKGLHPAGLNFGDCFSYAHPVRWASLSSSSGMTSCRPTWTPSPIDPGTKSNRLVFLL